MKNLFVIGLTDEHRQMMEALPQCADVRIHGLLSFSEIRQADQIPIRDVFARAEAELVDFEESIDGIVGNWDFPVNVLVPMLRERFGLPTTSLESVVKNEHKHWSRLIQSEVVPDNIPPFEGVDPFDEHAAEKIHMGFPFWLKPVIGFCSYLGFYIDDGEALRNALELTRANIGRIANPATWVLDKVELPPGLGGTGGSPGAMCLAEGIIAGQQCTVEGYITRGRASTYGVVDSIRTPSLGSFASYQYPSRLPEHVVERMRDITCRVVEHSGLGESPFNVEFFWDERTDHVWLLEINTRLSESHTDMFEKVDGASNQGVMVDLALGNTPRVPRGEGEFNVAGKFFMRRFSDALVTRVPTPEEVAQIQEELPGTKITIRPREGEHLSDRPDQDSYSYELAWIRIGADTHEELDAKYNAVVERLHFEFEEQGERGGPQL